MTEELDDEPPVIEDKYQEESEQLQKEIVLHLKRYDTAPLNCTVSFMAHRMERTPDNVYKGLQELLSKGVVSPWERWQKGAITPYKLTDLPGLIDRGMEFNYSDIELLTESNGGIHNDAPLTVASGVGGSGKNYLVSSWAKDNLKAMSLKLKTLKIADSVKPPRGSPDPTSANGVAYDLELGYLNTFFRSLFFSEEIEPMYILYSSKDEDLPAFRKRTLRRLLEALDKMSSSLLEKVGKDKVSKAYIHFFVSMLGRYIHLAEEIGIPSKGTKGLSNMRQKLITVAGKD